MDVLIEREGYIRKSLSSLGILVHDFVDRSPSLEVTRRKIKNRTGYVFDKANHLEKHITITGSFTAKDIFMLESKKDEINGLISNDEPFYITKMLPTQEIYDFELPGQKAPFDLLNIPHSAYKYRYKVIMEEQIDYMFLGKSQQGLLMAVTINLVTADIPYGQTVPIDESFDTAIVYSGTAKCSQLEYPWTLKMTATENQSGNFSVTVGKNTLTHASTAQIKKDDIFLLKGIETLHNGTNVNVKTNYAYFILDVFQDRLVNFETTFVGNFEILNKIEFYK